MPGPRLNVSPPLFTPLPYGLLTSNLDIRSPDDPHWQSGITWESICAQGGTTYDECWSVTGSGSAPPPSSKSPTSSIGRRGALPFTVYAEVDCSAPGFWERAQNFVSDTLTQSEQWQVENALWTGVAGGRPVVWPHLAANTSVTDESGVALQSAAVTVSGSATPMDVVEGLGVLERDLANCYDGVGVIHAPRNLIHPLTSARLINAVGGRYYTVSGNLIIFGAGYTGSSPAGVTTVGQSWMYATGALVIYRGPQQIMPLVSALNRSKNTVKALAERSYLIGWDCCHLAVNISTGG